MTSDTHEPSPYLTDKEACQYLRYNSVAYFRRRVHRLGIPHIVRSRKLLFTKAALDSYMATLVVDPSSKRRGRKRAA